MCFPGFTSVRPRCKILLSRRKGRYGLKILVFTDSHGYNMGMAYAVDREKPDAVLHLGDHADDAQDLGRAFPGLVIISVRGNNDYGTSRVVNTFTQQVLTEASLFTFQTVRQ